MRNVVSPKQVIEMRQRYYMAVEQHRQLSRKEIALKDAIMRLRKELRKTSELRVAIATYTHFPVYGREYGITRDAARKIITYRNHKGVS